MGAICLTLSLCACAELEAKHHAEKASKSLLECQFQDALYHFQIAHEHLPDNRDILIGLTIAQTAWFLDNPDIRSILERAGLNTSVRDICLNFFQNDDTSVVSTPSQNSSCRSIELDNLSDTASTPIFDGAIDPTLTWNELIQSLYNHRTLLHDAATNALQIVQSMKPDKTWHTSSSNDVQIALHTADFAALSFVLSFLSASLDILYVYDFNFGIKDTIQAIQDKDYPKITQLLNGRLLTARSNATETPSSKYLHDAVKSLDFAIQSIEIIQEKIENDTSLSNIDGVCPKRISLFHWENMHPGILHDFDSASHVFDASKQIMDLSAFFNPPVSLNVEYLLTHLPVHPADEIIVNVENGALSWQIQNEITQINQSFTPNILEYHDQHLTLITGIDYRLNSKWLTWSFKSLL